MKSQTTHGFTQDELSNCGVGTSQRCAKNVYRDQSCGQFHTMRNVCWTLWRQKVLSV